MKTLALGSYRDHEETQLEDSHHDVFRSEAAEIVEALEQRIDNVHK